MNKNQKEQYILEQSSQIVESFNTFYIKMKVNYIEEMLTKEIENFDINTFELEENYVYGFYNGEFVEISLKDYKRLKNL